MSISTVIPFILYMENYIVSARKYRPSTFDTVVGQSALTDTLKNSIKSGHLAHAYLFCGPRGVGKTTCARIFAKTINCLNPGTDGEACGECESCKAFNEQRSLNIHELDAASNNGIDEMKALIEQTRIPPQVGKYKVFIIDEVHMLSTAAFNAFLKTLEEPPHYVIFILATTEKHKLLPTILSRCQIYDFNRMNVQDIVNHLKGVAANEGIQAEDAALNVIAEKADGGMRDALSIFDQVAAFCNGNITYQQTIKNLNVLDYDYYFKLVDYFLGGDIPKVMTTFNDILNKGFEASHFVGGLNNHFRNLLMSRDTQTLPLIEASDEVRRKYGEQAQRCKPQFLYAAIRRCTDCDINYKVSQNRRLLVEITLIEIAQMATEEIPYSGRSPKAKIILKQIFKRAGQTTGNAPTGANNARQTVQPTAQPQSALAPSSVPQGVPNAAINQESASPIAAFTPKQNTQHTSRVQSFSIKEFQETQKTQVNPYIADSNQDETQSTDITDKPVDPMELASLWRQYAAQLPREQSVIADRMGQFMPSLVEGTKYEVVVENEMIVESIRKVLSQVVPYMRSSLSNNSLNIEVRARKFDADAPLLTRIEQFAKMKESNPAFKKLAEELILDLL